MTDVPPRSTPMPALPCGRDADALVAQVAEGFPLDDHQRACPHCRAAIIELDGRWAPVRAVAGHRLSAPDSVVDNALRRLRGRIPDTEYGRLEEADGHTTIAARVVVVLARHLAATVPGVRAALSALATGGSTAVQITLAASYGQDLAALAERTRATVARGIREQTGLDPVVVDVVIDDVLDDP